ncbi:WecB/TagA/CpsF family glycosyltransferase [Rhodococcus sp. H29-C3]|nr:WecB/TagA/CpsF family glycosyltransferase [Rhodococcus sp. H29-C3]MDJ0362571.1 WecB/TagA/CpsF family glycosyltransferase [Rhodococcus sp. H29-C3]
MNRSGLNFPDGAPIVWFMKVRSGHGKASRVRGPSLFKETLKASQSTEIQHFLLGTTTETLDKLTDSINMNYPGVKIAGTFSPPFAPVNNAMIKECLVAIEATRANIIWVALGTPKQDFLANELSMKSGRPCIAVGAAFDFVAGTVKEAPPLIQNSGFEWAYRFAMEPRRLWRRYLIGNMHFLYSALFQSGSRNV